MSEALIESASTPSMKTPFQIPKLGTFVLLEAFDNASKLDQVFSNLKFDLRMLRISLLNAILFKPNEVEGFIEKIVKHESPKLSFKFEYFPFEDFVKDNKQHGTEMLTWFMDLRDLMYMYNTRHYMETPRSDGDVLLEDAGMTTRLMETSAKLKNGRKILEACANIGADNRLYLKREDGLDVIEVRSSLLIDFYLAARELELFLVEGHPLAALFMRSCNIMDAKELTEECQLADEEGKALVDFGPCFLDGQKPTHHCMKCKKNFCDACLSKYHGHKDRKDHGEAFVKL